MSRLVACPLAQKVQRRIVSDAKQPSLEIGDRSGLRKSIDRLYQRFLDHVLAIDDRARHARAVTMELGPQFAETPIESSAFLVGARPKCAHEHVLMVSRLAKHAVVADDRRVAHLRRLAATLFDAGLEGPERLQLEDRVGAVAIDRTEVNESSVTERQSKIVDAIRRFRRQFLKHRPDQALVLLRGL